MAKQDRELLARLRAVGLRKEIARPLSAAGADARKKSVRAARAAIQELRALADELERRLPAEEAPATARQAAPATRARRTRSTPAASRSRSTPAATRRTRTAARKAPAAAAARSKPASGGNREAIAAALRSGPMTASEIAAKTGISVATVSTTLSRMAKAGQLAKAPRGYALPR